MMTWTRCKTMNGETIKTRLGCGSVTSVPIFEHVAREQCTTFEIRHKPQSKALVRFYFSAWINSTFSGKGEFDEREAQGKNAAFGQPTGPRLTWQLPRNSRSAKIAGSRTAM